MSLTTGEMTPADLAAVTGNNNNGFMDNSAWWIIILFLFAFNGNWGCGFMGGGNRGAADNYVLTSDFAQVERKLDGINNGICDSTFALNNTVTNGFAAAQQTMTQGFAGLNTGMVQQGYENRIAVNGIGQQLAQCCCDLKGGIADLKYTTAQGDNAITNAIGFASRDIIDNQNANYRALHDEIVANRIEDKNAQIQALQQQLFAQQLESSQAIQTNVLVDKLGVKCPIPAYLTCNPNAPLNYSVNYGTGCGCGA